MSLHMSPHGLLLPPGSSFTLPRVLDGEPFGRYMAMIGRELKSMDAVLAGLATHHVPSERLEPLIEKLGTLKSSDLRVVDAAVEEFADVAPSVEEWSNWALGGPTLDAINRCFKHTSLYEIVKALKKEKSEWSEATLEALKTRSPTQLEVALELVERGAKLDLASCFVMDMKAAKDIMMSSDFKTAIKTPPGQSPEWNPDFDKYLGTWRAEQKVTHAYFLPATQSNKRGFPNLDSLRGMVLGGLEEGSVSGLPREEDIRLLVSGEATAAGDLALTQEEILNFFVNNWNEFLVPHSLTELSFPPPYEQPVSHRHDESKAKQALAATELESSTLEAEEKSEVSLEEKKGGDSKDINDAQNETLNADASSSSSGWVEMFPRKYFFKDEEDPSDPTSVLGRRREMWGLKQRVQSVVDRRCEPVGGSYLRWRDVK
ncbi:hypothetical protein HDU76_007720 [Blyttiomyces sp. JEL0837]|nr:hypothetical protein HDU76_007720 [Blyttiomyces sp. JEL0837]